MLGLSTLGETPYATIREKDRLQVVAPFSGEQQKPTKQLVLVIEIEMRQSGPEST